MKNSKIRLIFSSSFIPKGGWVNIPERWVSVKRNGGSTSSGFYNVSLKNSTQGLCVRRGFVLRLTPFRIFELSASYQR
ncbi:MAG: hypothetical protein EPN37_06590 [Chitinophagaceae bacterium]|nr:MAG: hypothetical protein EPN37_06590 [Chitinophagaceae bacterium]